MSCRLCPISSLTNSWCTCTNVSCLLSTVVCILSQYQQISLRCDRIIYMHTYLSWLNAPDGWAISRHYTHIQTCTSRYTILAPHTSKNWLMSKSYMYHHVQTAQVSCSTIGIVLLQASPNHTIVVPNESITQGNWQCITCISTRPTSSLTTLAL